MVSRETATSRRSSDASVTRRLLVMLVAIALPLSSRAGETEEALQLALNALAERTQVDVNSIKVVAAESVTWPDANSSCQKSTTTSTSQTQGYRVLLDAAGKLYPVHVRGQEAVICGRGIALASGGASAVQEDSTMQANAEPEPADKASQALISKARTDLAKRLAVEPDEIHFIKFKPVVWPDGGLGCPRPGMVYTQVQQDGVLIRLEVRGQRFDYHGGAGRDPFLCENPAADLPDRPEK